MGLVLIFAASRYFNRGFNHLGVGLLAASSALLLPSGWYAIRGHCCWRDASLRRRLFILASAVSPLMCATGVAIFMRVLLLESFWRRLMLSRPLVALELHLRWNSLRYYPALEPPHFAYGWTGNYFIVRVPYWLVVGILILPPAALLVGRLLRSRQQPREGISA